jgi:hypothetical protein
VAKKLLLEDTRKKQTSHGENQKKRDLSLDFSSANYGKMTRFWLGAIKSKDKINRDTLPAIYQRALVVAGIFCEEQTDDDMDSEEENDRANIESEADDMEDDVGSEMSSVH